MREARNASTMSKDPSSKVGAVLVKDRRIVGTGFNGFPRGLHDDRRLWDREQKLPRIVHAEMNAIINAGACAGGRNSTPSLNAVLDESKNQVAAVPYPVSYAVTTVLALIGGYIAQIVS